MGAQLVTLAWVYMPDDLSHPARLVLLMMCHQARDHGKKPGLYFGGWKTLAHALGHTDYTPAAERAVARAVAELAEAKLIDRRDVSRGHRVAYHVLPLVPGKHHPNGHDPKG